MDIQLTVKNVTPLPINVIVVLFYEKNRLTQWMLKTFKLNNSERSWGR